MQHMTTTAEKPMRVLSFYVCVRLLIVTSCTLLTIVFLLLSLLLPSEVKILRAKNEKLFSIHYSSSI